MRHSATIIFDNNILGVTGAHFFGRHIENAVGVEIEHLVFGRIANQLLFFGENHVARCGALVVGSDLNFAMLEHTDTTICGARINSFLFILFNNSIQLSN